jgi:hypothetical protein
MRPIKELLVLLREFLPGNIKEDSGGSICWSIDDMYTDDRALITLKECELLDKYIEDKEPDDHGSYPNIHGLHCGFWWPYGELAPRIEFLNKLIDELQ